jgi:hypothetical protein
VLSLREMGSETRNMAEIQRAATPTCIWEVDERVILTVDYSYLHSLNRIDSATTFMIYIAAFI